MSSTQEFKCIFCKDTFETKEELQVHFRKHGDPNFGQSKVKNEASSSSDKKDESEMVSCDVCCEVFPTIAKAITHKHKLHPDHDAKYFCPWCGKLFTLKHLLNKHLFTNHLEDKRDITTDSFPCHSCNVEFYIPSAMLYHNRFFHRQDTELPAIGYSRKLKKIKQDLLMIYYCPFCGEEHDNKINLHKHMVDEHFDENQHPEDVLRCPLCEAIFYHLDAYELHLTFHSVDDLYSEKNEIVSQITEFSLEAVPPLMEKVENDIPDEAVLNPDISDMLSFAMDDAADSDPERVKKKRKKHKKSKKSAITLDEFLNMNQDVFGGNLDFQGIEEVPTQVINKSLKPKKKVPAMSPGSKISSADIAKLKQQGIVVKMKSTKGPAQNKKIPQRVPNTAINKLPSTSAVKKPTDSDCTKVIAKLINQSNSQIKIVKKPIQSTQVESSGNTLQPSESTSKTSDNESDQTINQATTSDNQQPEKSDQKIKDSVELPDSGKDESNQAEKKTSKINNPFEALQTIRKNITIKPINKAGDNSPKDKYAVTDKDNIEMEEDKSDLDDTEEATNTPKECHQNNDVKSPIIANQSILKTNESTALKHMSKNVTIKPVSLGPTKICDNKTSTISETQFSDESNEDLEKMVSSTSNSTRLDAVSESRIISNLTNPLKRLSKTITVKPCQNESKNHVDNEKVTEDTDEKVPEDTGGKGSSNISENSTESEHERNSCIEKKQQIPISTNIGEQLSVKSTKIPNRVSSEQEVQNLPDRDNKEYFSENAKPETLTEFPRHLEALKKLGSHITFTSNKSNVETNDNNEKKIENQNVKIEAPSHLDALKKLGSNITLKSNKPTGPENDNNMASKETANHQTRAESPLHIQALKKLGSNITFKSNKTEDASKITGIESNLLKNTTDCSNLHQITQKIVNKELKGNSSPNIKHNNKITSYNEGRKKSGTFKNISTKSIATMNVSQEVNCNMVGKIVKNKCTTNEYNESEIFSVDDSDDEDLNAMSSKFDIIKNEVTKNAGKNLNITNQNKKAFVGPARFKNLGKNIEDTINKTISQANTALENSLRKLSQHITIKPNKPDAVDNCTTADPDDNWDQNSDSNDSTAGKIKISEVTENEPDNNLQSDDDDEIPKHESPIVDSPEQSDNDAPHSGEEIDFESRLQVNTVKKQPPSNKNLNELKNLSKEICIRPIKRDQSPSTSTTIQDHVQTTQQNKIPNSNHGNKKINKCASAQKSMASNKLNTVSKEVTVKTYQTETVIEEITTTVTKTIRTVNQTMKQENSTAATNNAQTNNSLIGVKPMTVRQRGRPLGTKVVRPNNPPVKKATPNTCNQLIPMGQIRPSNPRMPIQKNTPTSQQGPAFTKQLKIAPNVNLRPSVKRPSPNHATSMAKKMKESSVTSTEVSSTTDKGGCMKQSSAASHVSESSFISTTQTNKGNTGISQIKTQAHSSSSQQVSKISNLAGMKITKTAQSQKSTTMEIKSDVSANKSTLDAIERLQKSGLLVKKPRLEEENVESDYSDFDET